MKKGAILRKRKKAPKEHEADLNDFKKQQLFGHHQEMEEDVAHEKEGNRKKRIHTRYEEDKEESAFK